LSNTVSMDEALKHTMDEEELITLVRKVRA